MVINQPSISNVVLCRYKNCDSLKILQDTLKVLQALLPWIISVAVAFPSPVSVSVEL